MTADGSVVIDLLCAILAIPLWLCSESGCRSTARFVSERGDREFGSGDGTEPRKEATVREHTISWRRHALLP